MAIPVLTLLGISCFVVVVVGSDSGGGGGFDGGGVGGPVGVVWFLGLSFCSETKRFILGGGLRLWMFYMEVKHFILVGVSLRIGKF